MVMTCRALKELLEQNLPGATVQVTDLTGTSDHFGVHVISTAFAGKSLVDQHKLVHAACGPHLTTTIHALQIKTQTPDA